MQGPLHLQCPACGHVFMAAHSGQEGVQTCAHCAFIGPGTHFAVVTPNLGAAPIRFQKRSARMRPEWGLETSEPEAPAPAEAPRHLTAHLTQSGAPQRLQPAAHPGSPPIAPDELIAPTVHRPILRWILTAVTLIAIVAVVSLLAWEKIQLRIRQKAAESMAAAQNAARQPARSTTAAQSLPTAMQGAILTQAALPDAERLTQILFTSSDLEKRLTAIDEPEKHRQQVSDFFSAGSPDLVRIIPISLPPLALVDLRRIAMFKVITSRNPGGALAWVKRTPDDRAVLDWPLFHETHEKGMTPFVQKPTDTPSWFYVGLKRSHSFDLPEPLRSEHEVFDIDGSTDGSSRTKAFLPKKTPLARAMAGRIQWGEFYYGRILLGWVDIGGEKRPTLLDCEGIDATLSP